ncbi:MAG: methyltransferase domain-containing protein [Rickettsiales bacterium]|nr:methyltransferase domain-containing protein [Rickettsiales bacterium]
MFYNYLIIMIFMCLSTIGASVSAHVDNYQEVIKTYGNDNLADKPPFQGGYINFGYWKNIPTEDNSKISQNERVQASFNLYKLIIDKLNIQQSDNVLEVGCGQGYGSAYVATEYKPHKINGIDISPYQIERAKHLHSSILEQYHGLEFQTSPADALKKPNNYYDKIYSVEAAQYFPSMNNFAKEMHRILKTDGVIVFTTLFSTDVNGYGAAKKLLPTVEQNIDRLIPVNDVRQAFINNGFIEIETERIGQHVFKGFDLWISQVEDAPWGRNFYKLYKSKNINYYVLSFKKVR